MDPRVACIQAHPIVLDAAASLEKAATLLDAAARTGATLAVFPEMFVPGYPQWAHSARFEHPAQKKAFGRYVRNSLRIPDDLGIIAEAARSHEMSVVIGVSERDPVQPALIHNAMAVFGPDGGYLGKHQKLLPTHHERIIHAPGAARHLRVFESSGLRYGGLLCGENYMPLARYAIYAQGIHVYVAPTADDSPGFQTAMRHIAREARAYVVSPNILQRKDAFPDDWELADDPAWAEEGEWNARGGSLIVAPDGEPIAGPVWEEETILTADIDLERVVAERQVFDPAGHFARSDALRLRVQDIGEF